MRFTTTASLAGWLLAAIALPATAGPVDHARHGLPHRKHHKCGGPPTATTSSTPSGLSSTSHAASQSTLSISSTTVFPNSTTSTVTSSQETTSSSIATSLEGTTCTALTTTTETDTIVDISTVTPDPVTTLVTQFETTTLTFTTQETLTFSTTSTDYATETDTTTSTSIATATLTITATTTAAIVTQSAPENLVPIRSQYPDTTSAGRRRSVDYEALTRVPELFVLPAREYGSNQTFTTYEPTAPCTSTIVSTTTVSTEVTSTTETTLPISTIVASTTSTVTTETTSLLEPASTTESYSTISTLTSTSTVVTITTTTSITTSTRTLPNPTPTYYAGCGPEYLLADINGRYINLLSWGAAGAATLSGPRTAYECCVACLVDRGTTCAGAAWTNNQCKAARVAKGGVCAADQPGPVFNVFGGSVNIKNNWAVMNGLCGKWARP